MKENFRFEKVFHSSPLLNIVSLLLHFLFFFVTFFLQTIGHRAQPITLWITHAEASLLLLLYSTTNTGSTMTIRVSFHQREIFSNTINHKWWWFGQTGVYCFVITNFYLIWIRFLQKKKRKISPWNNMIFVMKREISFFGCKQHRKNVYLYLVSCILNQNIII